MKRYWLLALSLLVCSFFAMAQKTKQKKNNVAMRLVSVGSVNELKNALQYAKPGDSIVIAAGTYTGKFVIPASAGGKEDKYIVLEARDGVILETGDINSGYVLHHQASYWKLKGFTVKNGLKGIVLDGANYNILEGLKVTEIGEEGIHLRKFSSHNTIQHCEISYIGKKRPGYGEGIYIGSAVSNWEKYSNGQPDKCDSNKVIGNIIGPFVTAESIDIKEGTTGGVIKGNSFYSQGISGENSADSWIDVKGNNYLIEDNKGINKQPSVLKDGYQVNCAVAGWGSYNEFKNNISEVNADGYAINIRLKSSKGEAVGNKVFTSNKVNNAKSGLSNIPLTN